ncbi:MAG TPA: glycosyltransferase [Asticcacaulis sp.]|nr:glycosyltransferase [Asticcacaulis sp.]
MDARILNVMLAKGKGGVESMGLRYHEALAAEGFEVVSLGHPKGVLAENLSGDVFQPLTALCDRDPFAAFRLAQKIRAFRPHLVLTHGNRATGLSLMPFVAGDARTVQVLHNRGYKPHIQRVDAVVCVSAGVRDSLEAAYPSVRPIEVANFAHLKSHQVKALPGTRPVIGALGRLHEVKRFDLLLKSAGMLRQRGYDFALKIAGDGPERETLKAMVAEYGLSDNVEFCGWAADPKAFLSGLDLFVLSSRSEGFGLVVIEAMAAGVPVVASDIEGPRDILKAGSLGKLFESGNAVALTNAIGEVFADWKTALGQARQAQRHAMQTFGFAAGRARLGSAIRTIRAQATGRAEAAGWPALPVAAPAAEFGRFPAE